MFSFWGDHSIAAGCLPLSCLSSTRPHVPSPQTPPSGAAVMARVSGSGDHGGGRLAREKVTLVALTWPALSSRLPAGAAPGASMLVDDSLENEGKSLFGGCVAGIEGSRHQIDTDLGNKDPPFLSVTILYIDFFNPPTSRNIS
ncbi:UNVERIFIED_CONTAM: hypothetical protein K2H54_000363 [Gekko kuhli]